MKLTDLQPRFLEILDDGSFKTVERMDEADGVLFLCPKCFVANGGPKGTHAIICWRPHVTQDHPPNPGRWQFHGHDLTDLTLVAGSSSILLTSGCRWHGFITDGQVTGA